MINPGKVKADEAAQKYGCSYILPKFPEDFRLSNGKRPTDFNDLHSHFGLGEIRNQFDNRSTSRNWPDPKPISAELLPVESFDFEKLLPDVLRDFVKDEADRMPCAPDFIAAALVVALGSLVGARCALRPKREDDWTVVPNLWGGCVGVPSSKKSPAIEKGMKPLNLLATKSMEKHQDALGAYEAEKVVYEAKRSAIETNIKKAASSKSRKNEHQGCEDIDKLAAELRSHQKGMPKSPIQKRFKTNDTTIEKFGEMLRDNPQGLLVLRDELAGLLASWERFGHEGDRAFFIESWNGYNDFNTDRIGRKEIYIPNLCVSIFGGLQPDKLIKYLEQAANALENDGMLQRFQILVYPDPPAWAWRDRAPDKRVRGQVFTLFETLAEFDPIQWGASFDNNFDKFPYFRFDEEAQDIFIKWSEELNINKLPDEDNPLIKQHLGKYEKLFPALALLFHLVDCIGGGLRGVVRKESALRAANWCHYLESHARRCYGLLADEGFRAAQALVNKIQNFKKFSDNDFTVRDIKRNQWRYLTTEKVIQSALDWLEDEGWIKGYSTGGRGPGSGRPTVKYKINPKIQKEERENSLENEEESEKE